MRHHYSVLIAAFVFLAACSPSLEEVSAIIEAHLVGSGDDDAVVMNVVQTDKNIYSGQYSTAADETTLITYPFTAIVRNGQVIQFFKETDDNKVLITTFSQNENNTSGLNYITETKAQYDERIKREEEERRAAERRASGSGLGQKGASWLLSGDNNIIQIISYQKANALLNSLYQGLLGSNVVVYTYKVLEANGFGGTKTASYDLVFQNGSIVLSSESSPSIF